MLLRFQQVLTPLAMKECYQIIEHKELADYLKQLGRDAFKDWNYQLQTNYGFVHELENGKIAFFVSNLNGKAILFDNKNCFDDIIKADRFPIENPDKNWFEIEGDRMLTFHLQSDHYRQHLNNVLKFDFAKITKEAAHAYMKKVIGRSIKKLSKSTDIIALISIIGELIKQETNGKWFLTKRYGTYNPTYEPNIVTGEGKVVHISTKIMVQIKWRVSSLDDIFTVAHSKLDDPLNWENYSNGRNNLIMLE